MNTTLYTLIQRNESDALTGLIEDFTQYRLSIHRFLW